MEDLASSADVSYSDCNLANTTENVDVFGNHSKMSLGNFIVKQILIIQLSAAFMNIGTAFRVGSCSKLLMLLPYRICVHSMRDTL